MNSRSSRIIIVTVSVFVALFLAWRIGLWLEPEPQQKSSGPALSPPAAKEPPFATGKVGEGLLFELRSVKVAEGGRSVEGIGIVRFNIKRGDIKPAAIAMLTTLKGKVPAAERMIVHLRPAVDCPVCAIAEVSYERGKTVLRYGIPSLEQIENNNAQIGVKSDSGETVERTRLYLPDGETYGNGLAVTRAIASAREKNPGMNEEQLLEQASVATGLPYVVARRLRDYMTAYYTGNRHGEEVFDIPLR